MWIQGIFFLVSVGKVEKNTYSLLNGDILHQKGQPTFKSISLTKASSVICSKDGTSKLFIVILEEEYGSLD